MKTTQRLKTLLAAAATLLAASSLTLNAETYYWGSDTTADNTSQALTSWQDATHWFTDAAGTTAALNAPLAADNVIFSITSLNATQLLPRLYAETTINSITFNNTVQFDLQGGSANRLLHFGAGGVTMNGTATATIGTSTSSRNILGRFAASQTWTNTSTGNLNFRNSAAASDGVGAVVVTFNAASSGGLGNSGSYSDGTGSTFGMIVDSTGTGNVSMASSLYSGGTTVKRGLLSSGGQIGTSTVYLGDTSGSDDARINITGIASANIIVQANVGSGLTALTGSGSGDYQGTITMNRDLSIGSVSGSGTTIAYSGLISGVGNLTIGRVATGSSNPTVTISNANNSYTGKTTISSATVIVSKLSDAGENSSLGAATGANSTITMSTVSASTLRYNGTGDTTDRVIEIAAAATLEQSGTGHLEFTGNLNSINAGSNRTLTLRGATEGTAEISGIINNIGGGNTTGLTKTDSGAWTLSNAANSYTGVTSITGGVLEVSKLTAGGDASSIGMSTTAAGNLSINGGTLRYVGAGDSTNRLFTAGANGTTLDASGADAISFTATTTPSYGTTNQARSITLTGTNADANTLASNIANNGASGTVSLTKDGVGTWVLTGNSLYTGGTTVAAGTLLVNNASGSGTGTGAVNVGENSTLGGSGTVNGLVTTAGTTSFISPGNSPGTLNLLGGLDASAGTTFVFELGTSSDLLNLGSGVFTGSTADDGLRFNFSDSGGLLVGNPYTLITFGSSTGLAYSDLVANVLPSGYMMDSSFGDGGFQINSGSLQAQFAVIPEPSTIALVAISLLAAGLLRKRRRI